MNKDIYIWGAGVYGEKTLRDCKKSGINILGFVDSKEALWNTEKLGTIIYPPKEILQKQNVEILIAVANKSVFMEINEICEKASIKTATFQELKKRQIIDALQNVKPLHTKNSPQYIVSLTSYGERLTTIAPYAIATIFQQTVLPDKILLWAAYEDEETVQTMLKDVNSILHKLVEKGLETRYCEDIKSYKKLIPAIENFPEDYIITADDDVFYPSNWLEQLLAEHRKNPKKIVCHRAHGIKVDENHNLLPYNEWDNCINKSESSFPTGSGGILYPLRCFYKDIANNELFMKLAPKADDIWFWAMAVINKEYFGDEGPYVVIENGHSKDLQDIEPEQQQDGKALWNYNCSQGGNDKQLKDVIEQYPQIREYLQKIEPFNSSKYWDERYAMGGNSGAGSYDRLAQFKAEVLNDFVKKQFVNSVIEFGCGDGNQLSLARYPKYLGFDVSETAINICKNKFLNDKTKEFRLMKDLDGEKADLVLSLDVIYHLIEDSVFKNYMETLFCASTKYVIIYASNKTSPQWVQHVKHRTFTDWVETNKKDWNLLQFIPNKYPSKNDSGDDPTTSFADFYIFGNKNVVSKFKSEKISVLVPVYNAEKYLRQCLDSIVNQAYKNVEIICVNDASTDNSLEILDEYAKKDDRIIIVNKRANEGSSQARKTGFEHSNGKYILPVDSDDYIEPDMLEKLHHCAVFGNYDIVCCGYFENRENYIRPFNPQVFPENKIDRIRCGIFGFGNAKVVWNKLAKYEIYKTIKFPKENNGEDCFITAQLFYRADRIGFYPLPLYHWQFNENSMTNNKLLAKKRYEDRKMNYEHIIEFCREKFGDDLSIFEPELSRRMADIEKQEPKKEMYLCQK